MAELKTKATKASVEKFLKYKTGKSCLYIKRLEDVDLRVLNELIMQSVQQTSKS